MSNDGNVILNQKPILAEKLRLSSSNMGKKYRTSPDSRLSENLENLMLMNNREIFLIKPTRSRKISMPTTANNYHGESKTATNTLEVVAQRRKINLPVRHERLLNMPSNTHPQPLCAQHHEENLRTGTPIMKGEKNEKKVQLPPIDNNVLMPPFEELDHLLGRKRVIPAITVDTTTFIKESITDFAIRQELEREEETGEVGEVSDDTCPFDEEYSGENDDSISESKQKYST